MAWANLQKPAAAAGIATAGFTVAQTFGSACSNGSRIVVAVSAWDIGKTSTCTGVADTVNTYTKDIDIIDSSSGVHTSIWSAPNTSTSALTVTATLSVTASARSICIMEFSGLSATSGSGARDGTAVAVSTNTSTGFTITTAATGATTGANELAVCVATGNGDNRTFTKGSTYTLAQSNAPDANADIGTEYKDTGSSGVTVTGDWAIGAGNGHNDAVLVIYKLAAAAGGYIPPRRYSQAVNRASTY